MNLDKYLESPNALSLKELAKKAKISYTTLKNVRRGMKFKLYDNAKRVSEATNGKVTIKELCE